MLQVTFYRDGRGRFAGLSARGHADFAEHGEDIVCAAVSAIVQAARLGLAQYAGDALSCRQLPGELHLRWPARAAGLESVRAIVTTAELAVREVARRYPRHVRLVRRKAASVTQRGPGRVTSVADRRRRNDV